MIDIHQLLSEIRKVNDLRNFECAQAEQIFTENRGERLRTQSNTQYRNVDKQDHAKIADLRHELIIEFDGTPVS